MPELPVWGLKLPLFHRHKQRPVKIVDTADGGMMAWKLDYRAGGWLPATGDIDEIFFNHRADVRALTREEFIREVERFRARYLTGEGPIFALYETIDAIKDVAKAEDRPTTPAELAMITGIRRRTFRMFEEELQRRGDPGADPSLAD